VAERILTRTERASARLCTGSLAHFVAGLTDWLVLVGTLTRTHLRDRRTRRRAPIAPSARRRARHGR
jgi:hypothetical protein